MVTFFKSTLCILHWYTTLGRLYKKEISVSIWTSNKAIRIIRQLHFGESFGDAFTLRLCL